MRSDFGPPMRDDFGPPMRDDFGLPIRDDFGPPMRDDFGSRGMRMRGRGFFGRGNGPRGRGGESLVKCFKQCFQLLKILQLKLFIHFYNIHFYLKNNSNSY